MEIDRLKKVLKERNEEINRNNVVKLETMSNLRENQGKSMICEREKDRFKKELADSNEEMKVMKEKFRNKDLENRQLKNE